MEKFIPFDKLSKRKKREHLAKRRKTWGGISPVTKKPNNPKEYKREKARKWSDDTTTDVPYIFILRYFMETLKYSADISVKKSFFGSRICTIR